MDLKQVLKAYLTRALQQQSQFQMVDYLALVL